jgi:flagellin-like hook-associated protein FlgL
LDWIIAMVENGKKNQVQGITANVASEQFQTQTKNQILTQAATGVLAQANQSQSSVLNLLNP